tara:strand:- start:768 stop:2966 length:2199 start_codon:yes stop_codon:yes gene_type:complete
MAIGRISGQMLKANLERSGTDLAFETTLLVLDVTNSRVGIGTASPGTTLHVSATDALRLPSGTTGQRPGSPANGDIRYNTTTSQLEGYVNGAYANLASGTAIQDADGDTSVDVEPSADLDEVHITVAGTKRAKFGASTIELGVTGISTTASTISSTTTNGDITFTPNGTGKVIVTNGITLQTNTADINGGAIDGVAIGSNAAATALTVNGGTVAITDTGGDGTMDGVVIGGTTAAAGSFTTLNASGNATITGNLTVNGTTTTIDSVTLTIEDPLLELAKNNSGGSANTFDQGLFMNRGSDANVSFFWDESEDEFAFAVTSGEDGTTAGNITIDNYADIQAKDATFNKMATQGITIEDNEIAGSRSNDDITITPAGTGSVLISKIDANSGTIDNTVIGGTTAAAGTFTTTTAVNTQTTNIKANDGTAAIVLTDSTGAVAISTAVDINGGNFTFNEGSASVDARFESNGDTHALFIDGSEDHVGIMTSSPAYDLDVSGSTDAIRVPVGNTAQRPSAATGIIRFNSQTGKYEGCQDGSTFVELATAGDTPTFSKVSTTGDGSTTTFSGFFGSAPASANNVFVYIDNVYQEPTENYTVSSTNITFTSAPHSGARIFAITGADGTALASGGVSTSETSATNFTSTATTIMSFNATSYRSAEAFITTTDSANTEYEVAKALIVHDGSTAYVTVYGQTSSTDANLSTYSVTIDSGSVLLQAVSSGGQQSAKVQYRLSGV